MPQIFSVYDSKAEAFSEPFFAPNGGVACRMFAGVANEETSNLCQYPADYTLFEIGSFDPITGKIASLEVPVNHGLALVHQASSKRPTNLDTIPLLPMKGNGITGAGATELNDEA